MREPERSGSGSSIRVWQIVKQLGRSKDEVLAALRDAGVEVTGNFSAVDRSAAEAALGAEIKPEKHPGGRRTGASAARQRAAEALLPASARRDSAAQLFDPAEIELPEPGDDVAWGELAERFLPLYLRAAKGEIEVSGAQRQLLDKIMDRGFGKVGRERSGAAADLGVVVLPMLYSDEKPAQVCPQCAARLEGGSGGGEEEAA